MRHLELKSSQGLLERDRRPHCICAIQGSVVIEELLPVHDAGDFAVEP